MLRFIFKILLLWVLSFSQLWAEADMAVDETHIHIENGVVYCDVQTFAQESYVLKVIASGSPMTAIWQFDVLETRNYWLDKNLVSVRLGRQVIPDLVTKRWLMRDLSGGVVKYTTDPQEAMHFLTEMNHAAVVDTSLLHAESTYTLETKLFIFEGEDEERGWWSGLTDWGESMREVELKITQGSVGE